MTLSQGDRLGRYEVLGPIGTGGMGEVWRARDTELEPLWDDPEFQEIMRPKG
jgi:serine/threonine protein kinase